MPHLEPKGWYHNRYLPHFDGGEIAQFVTFRLVDSLPKEIIHQLREETELQKNNDPDIEKVKRIEEWLDKGTGECWIRDAKIAQIVQDTLFFHHTHKYRLHAWVIMPNHVHVLFTPTVGNRLFDIVREWKSFTAKRSNQILNRKGAFWQEEYFDRFIRSEKHLYQTVSYIEENPVKAGLCELKEQWPFSSASVHLLTRAGQEARTP